MNADYPEQRLAEETTKRGTHISTHQTNVFMERTPTSNHIYVGKMTKDDDSQITLDKELQHTHHTLDNSTMLPTDVDFISTTALLINDDTTQAHRQDTDEYEMILHLGWIPTSWNDLDALIVETSLSWRKALLQVVENTTTYKYQKLHPHLQISALDLHP